MSSPDFGGGEIRGGHRDYLDTGLLGISSGDAWVTDLHRWMVGVDAIVEDGGGGGGDLWLPSGAA
jgi:hypothetical protein